MNLAALVLFAFAVTFCKTCVDATVCQPLSKFKIDCDECQCSEDGTEYSCTVRQCGPTSFLEPDDEDDYVLGKKPIGIDPRNAKMEMPYINDEIPPSREQIDNEFSDDLIYDEVKPHKDDDTQEDEENNGGESFQDVSLEQDASVFETGLPDKYRLKRYIKPYKKRYIRPHGKRYV